MKRITKACIGVALVAVVWLNPLDAQDDEEYGQGGKLNTNLGVTLTAPLNPTAQFVNFGWGVTGGAGYNISSHHSLIGEVMWNRLYPTSGALVPLKVALQSTNVKGHSDLVAITGNYRLELRGKLLGTYFIGGGGWYYRKVSISREVPAGSSITCTPTFIWWGFTCESGTVTTSQLLASPSSSTWGANGGIGFTVLVGEPSYRFYVESRYHYAPTKNVKTQLILITTGIRF